MHKNASHVMRESLAFQYMQKTLALPNHLGKMGKCVRKKVRTLAISVLSLSTTFRVYLKRL